MGKCTYNGLIALVVLAASSCTSQTQNTQKASLAETASLSQTSEASSQTVAFSDPIICKKFASTGSRLKTEKVCARKSIWTKQQAREDKGVRDFFDNASAGS